VADLKLISLGYNRRVAAKIKELQQKINKAVEDQVKKPFNLYLSNKTKERLTAEAKKRDIPVSQLCEIIFDLVLDDLEKDKK
jgi:hypothetical protein